MKTISKVILHTEMSRNLTDLRQIQHSSPLQRCTLYTSMSIDSEEDTIGFL